MATFTLPAELRDLTWHHQRQVYGAMLQSSWATISTFARNHRQLEGKTGAIAVLHTHSRRHYTAPSEKPLDDQDTARSSRAFTKHPEQGRYLYRGVISEKDILSCSGEKVHSLL